MSLERIAQNTPATLSTTVEVDGTLTDPDASTVTVTVSRADGTILVNAAAATRQSTGVYSTVLTQAHTALLDTLTATWAFSLSGVVAQTATTVEIVGGFLFTLAQARVALGDPNYDTEAIADARTYAEGVLESELGYALVPRYALDRLSGNGWRVPLRLRHPYVRAVRSVMVDGTAMSPSDVTGLSFDGAFLYGGSWSTGYGNIVVGYEHGLDQPPAGASRAALELATDYLGGGTTGGSIDPRAESVVTVDGTLRLATGGRFSLPSVEAFVRANRLPSIA